MINKMADKMDAAYQCLMSWSLLVIFNRISSKLHIWIASINSRKFEYRFCPTNDNQDSPQNGRHVLRCGHSNLDILKGFLPISYMDDFSQTLV